MAANSERNTGAATPPTSDASERLGETVMHVPRGERIVERPHTPPNSPLRAWSAADQLVLDHLGTDDPGPTLIVNDEFGALTCGLAECEPMVWSDSVSARAAIDHNLAMNGFAPLGDRAATTTVTAPIHPAGPYRTVVVRVPKTAARLDAQLEAIAHVVAPDAVIVGAGMTRHVHNSTTASFERWIGPTTTSLAVRKARLIHATVDPSRSGPVDTEPPFGEFTTAEGIRVAELPGTFSAGHLDVGSALLLEVLHNYEVGSAPTSVADLGCGNGVLAATLAKRWPAATFVLTDVSDHALMAARHTWSLNDLAEGRARIEAVDGLAGCADASIDVVVTNPPFHQGHALDRELTDRLLADAARAIRDDGTIFVVVQRHLHLHTRMKRWFREVTTDSKHPTHAILVGRHPRR